MGLVGVVDATRNDEAFLVKVTLLFSSCQFCLRSGVALVIRAKVHPIDEEAVRADDGQARRHRIQQLRDVPVVLPLEVDGADVPQLVGEGEEEGGALTVVQDEALTATTIDLLTHLWGLSAAVTRAPRRKRALLQSVHHVQRLLGCMKSPR